MFYNSAPSSTTELEYAGLRSLKKSCSKFDQNGNIERAPELPFCHRHTECTATLGAIPSERDPETSLATPTYLVNEKISTSKQVRKKKTGKKGWAKQG